PALFPSQNALPSVRPLPNWLPHVPEQAALGRALFFDQRLSSSGDVSCASCHNLGAGGADERALSLGAHGGVGVRNAPTVLNAALNFRQFWDGRAPTLEAQVDGPLLDPREMGSTWEHVLAIVNEDENYQRLYEAAFHEPPSKAGVRAALAAFQRTLLTPGSRFDQFLQGNKAALSVREREGWDLFGTYGCDSCHNGVNLGGNMFQRLGVMADYFAEHGDQASLDEGRFQVTADPQDRFVFKTPSLRNVALTAPYFHDGSCATLREAVEAMIVYQVGRPLREEHVARLVALLESMTGDLPKEAP
ncbi:MAG: cytochrome-c peroxidase, partial [Planctomycetales bacterium]|nr:cytochrome-c peroxidase [Planctomycetales bacterium]